MKIKKALAVILCSALLGTSLCGCTAGVNTGAANLGLFGWFKDSSNVVPTEEEVLKEVVTKVANAGTSEADKEETVYVKTDANGNVNSVIVSDWLKNVEETEELEDATTLTNIVNVKGRETYTSDGNKLTWEAAGEDIFYQGKTDKSLPVDVAISYSVDGKEYSASEMAGKSGHVVITIDYKNKSANTVTIGGKEETIYTPFTAVTAFTLDENKFKNVKVDGGAVVADGKRNIVVGMAFPGLVESLNGGKSVDENALSEALDDISIPTKVVVEADAEDFELGTTITLVTADITKALGLDSIENDTEGKVDEIKDSLDEFSDAGVKLADGSGELKDGAQKLADGSNELKNGMDSLYNGIVEYTNGASKVADGAGKLDSGAGELSTGAANLQSGIGQVQAGGTTLKNGVSSVEDAAKQINDGAATISEKTAELSAGASSLNDGVNSLVGQMDSIASGVGSAANAAGQISAGLDQIVAATNVQTDPASIDTSAILGSVDLAAMLSDQALGLNEAQIQALSTELAAMADNVARQAAAGGANTAKAQIGAAITGSGLQSGASQLASGLQSSYATLSSEETKNQLAALSNGAAALSNGAAALSQGTAQLSSGTTALYEGTTKLSAGVDSLNAGLTQVYDGAGKLKEGSDTLKAGTSELASGASKLTGASGTLVDGSKKLADGSSALAGGASDLLEGTVKLNDGMVKFNDEGVSKLTKVFDTDLASMKDRIKAISDMGKAYTTFAGAAEGVDSTVKFIIESEQIKKL